MYAEMQGLTTQKGTKRSAPEPLDLRRASRKLQFFNARSRLARLQRGATASRDIDQAEGIVLGIHSRDLRKSVERLGDS